MGENMFTYWVSEDVAVGNPRLSTAHPKRRVQWVVTVFWSLVEALYTF